MKYYIFDIDGTLADCEHRRPYITGNNKNWKAFLSPDLVEKDPPIMAIVGVAAALAHDARVSNAYGIKFVTGRPENLRRVTVTWLSNYLFQHPDTINQNLFMRPDDDYRPDHAVKTEIALKIGVENILCVFDDRNQTVAAWRALGIRCLQVAEGDY